MVRDRQRPINKSSMVQCPRCGWWCAKVQKRSGPQLVQALGHTKTRQLLAMIDRRHRCMAGDAQA